MFRNTPRRRKKAARYASRLQASIAANMGTTPDRLVYINVAGAAVTVMQMILHDHGVKRFEHPRVVIASVAE